MVMTKVNFFQGADQIIPVGIDRNTLRLEHQTADQTLREGPPSFCILDNSYSTKNILCPKDWLEILPTHHHLSLRYIYLVIAIVCKLKPGIKKILGKKAKTKGKFLIGI